MKQMIKSLSLSLVLTFASTTALFNAVADAGTSGHGGILVQVNGRWVPIEEAESYETADFIGLDQLPDGSNNVVRPELNKDYVRPLKEWLKFVAEVSPAHARALTRAGQNTRFIYVNRPLIFTPKELPKTGVDYKEYLKAAMYVPAEEAGVSTVYVSIPTMEQISQISDRRLSVKQNQGLLLLHELINANYVPQGYDATTRVILGRLFVDAYFNPAVKQDFLRTLAMNGAPLLYDRSLKLSDKITLLEQLKSSGVLSQIKFERGTVVTGEILKNLHFIHGLFANFDEVRSLVSTTQELEDQLNGIEHEENSIQSGLQYAMIAGYDDAGPNGDPSDWRSLVNRSVIRKLLESGIGWRYASYYSEDARLTACYPLDNNSSGVRKLFSEEGAKSISEQLPAGFHIAHPLCPASSEISSMVGSHYVEIGKVAYGIAIGSFDDIRRGDLLSFQLVQTDKNFRNPHFVTVVNVVDKKLQFVRKVSAAGAMKVESSFKGPYGQTYVQKSNYDQKHYLVRGYINESIVPIVQK